MRKALNLFTCMTVVLMCAAVTVAQTNQPASQTSGKKDTVVIRKRALGTVVSVDAVTKTFVVKSKTATLTFVVNEGTKVKVDGKDSALENVQSNQNVTVIYKHVGKTRVALYVYAKAAAQSLGKQPTKPGKE